MNNKGVSMTVLEVYKHRIGDFLDCANEFIKIYEQLTEWATQAESLISQQANKIKELEGHLITLSDLQEQTAKERDEIKAKMDKEIDWLKQLTHSYQKILIEQKESEKA